MKYMDSRRLFWDRQFGAMEEEDSRENLSFVGSLLVKRSRGCWKTMSALVCVHLRQWPFPGGAIAQSNFPKR